MPASKPRKSAAQRSSKREGQRAKVSHGGRVEADKGLTFVLKRINEDIYVAAGGGPGA